MVYKMDAILLGKAENCLLRYGGIYLHLRFAAITFNVNLYLIDDNIVGIMLRFIAGATGNYVLYYVVKK